MPDRVAMPKDTVAWSTSPQVAPASTRTVWSCGLTVVLRISDRSMTRAPSQTPKPAALWPPPRTAISVPCSRADRTQVMTSAVSRQRTMAAGRLSIMALYTARAWSYPGSPGMIRSPRMAVASSAYSAVVVVDVVMASPSGGSLESGARREYEPRRSRSVRSACPALRRRWNAGSGKANVPGAEVTLAAPQQRHAAMLRRHLCGGEQARDGGLLVVIGGPHPHHLGQPPHVVAGAPSGQGGVKGGPRGAGPALSGGQIGEQRQPVRHARERALRFEVTDAAPDQVSA